MKKKSLLFLIPIPLLLQLYLLFFVHFDGHFYPKDFEHGFKPSYSVNVSGLDPVSIDPLLKQSFHYLGMGKQMIAFESADGTAVLKLFNPMRPLKKNWFTQWKFWRRYNSLKWISREWFCKKARLKKLFNRNKITFEQFKEEGGLLFVHLAPSEKIHYFVNVTDRDGKNHVVNLKDTPFILQQKAVLVPQYLGCLIEQKRYDEAKSAIGQLQQLFYKRSQQGITDRIQTMENNYGFVGSKPIQIDVGRIRIDPLVKKAPETEYSRILSHLHEWLNTKYPELQKW